MNSSLRCFDFAMAGFSGEAFLFLFKLCTCLPDPTSIWAACGSRIVDEVSAVVDLAGFRRHSSIGSVVMGASTPHGFRYQASFKSPVSTRLARSNACWTPIVLPISRRVLATQTFVRSVVMSRAASMQITHCRLQPPLLRISGRGLMRSGSRSEVLG